MNANELIQELEDTEFYDNPSIRNNDLVDEAITMLRQQQAELTQLRESKKEDVAEIYKLKAEIEALKSGGEPVAWMQTWRNQRNEIARGLNFDRIGENDVALYEHPAKTPTDEEILTAIKEFAEEVMPYKEYENTYSDGWLDACIEIYSAVFAILRKAQEK